MKKKFLLPAFFLAGFVAASAQYACLDALELSDLVINGKFNPDQVLRVDTILSRYIDDPFGTPSQAFADNPFIAGYFDARMPHTLVPGGVGGTIGGLAGTLGGLDVTAVADGLAKFLVKRTKEELNVAFFSKFKETLEDPRYADLRLLFPGTHLLLGSIGDEIYDYNRYIQVLREAFRSDLLSLDDRLPGLIGNHPGFFDEHFGLAVSLNTACYLTRSLKSRVHPGDILEYYPMEYLVKPGAGTYFNRNWSGAIQTLQLFSGSLRDPACSGGNWWVGMEKISRLVRSRDATRLYLGLVYQVAGNNRFQGIPFEKGSLKELLAKVDFDRDYPAYRNYVEGFARKVIGLNGLLKEPPRPAGDSLAVETFARYCRATVGMVEYCTMACELPRFDRVAGGNLHDTLGDLFAVAYETCDLSTSLVRRNYPAAVNHIVSIYRTVCTEPLHDRPDSLQQAREVLARLTRYGAFLASVVTAKNSDEVSRAIEAAALPCGSSRIKRESPFNLSLNAYTGLFTGYEHISGMNDAGVKINAYGVAAPVGIAVSLGGHSFLGLWPGNPGRWSYSLFASLIDIGSLAAFRFQPNDSIAQVPTVRLRDIVSPGLFFSLGFPKCPLSLNLGAQVTPNLREVSVQQPDGTRINKYRDNTCWRFSAALVVDIPLFNFYTKTRK